MIGTYIVNSTRKETIYIGAAYPQEVTQYMVLLEKNYSWNLRTDNIYVSHSYKINEYTTL